jgi:hypothetical protein
MSSPADSAYWTFDDHTLFRSERRLIRLHCSVVIGGEEGLTYVVCELTDPLKLDDLVASVGMPVRNRFLPQAWSHHCAVAFGQALTRVSPF